MGRVDLPNTRSQTTKRRLKGNLHGWVSLRRVESRSSMSPFRRGRTIKTLSNRGVQGHVSSTDAEIKAIEAVVEGTEWQTVMYRMDARAQRGESQRGGR